MTADIELLPLPSPQVPFIDCDPSMTDIRRLVRWYEQGATEYARACVAHATAAKDAEIETLRAEVERVTCELMDAITRADKLAEALEMCLEMEERPLIIEMARAALRDHDQENKA